MNAQGVHDVQLPKNEDIGHMPVRGDGLDAQIIGF